jgi:proline iminopeptidase
MYISLLEKEIYYEQYGEKNKTAILYLHGGPGASCLDFTPIGKKLGEKYRVILIDQFGVLRSQAIEDGEKYGMDEQIDMLEDLRNKLGIDKWVVLGHSYGGSLACRYASKYCDSILAVIYDCPSFNFILSAKSLAKYMLNYFSEINNLEGIEKCKAILQKDYLPANLSVLFDMIGVLEQVKNSEKRNYLHNITFEEYNNSFSHEGIEDSMWGKGEKHLFKLAEDGKMFENYLEILKDINIPQLLLCGKYDPVCREEQLELFTRNAKDGRTVIFENSGHFARIEEPEKYFNVVSGFVDGIKKII